jgi:Flp pilus assembly protein protease CpaA
MIEIVAFSIALIGTIVASYYDLKTTEIPDILPVLMIIAGIVVNGLTSILMRNPENFILSLINGAIFALIGFSMYFSGQWGGGDAFLLTSIGVLIPKNIFHENGFPFVFTYLTNLFFIGGIYMLVYSFLLSIKSRKVWKIFKKRVLNLSLLLSFLFLSFLLLSSFLSFLMIGSVNYKLITFLSLAAFGLIILWIFSKTVEETIFVKRIPVSKLKVGDVLLESKRWDGITEKEIRRIKESGKKYVYIKTGVCFAPAFPIALIYTFLFGNSVTNFIKLLYLIWGK